MQGIWLVSYIATIFVLGHCVVSIICVRQTKSLSEILGVGFAAGSGCIGLLLFLLSLAGFKPGRGVILFIAAAATALFLFLWKRRILPRCTFSVPDRPRDVFLSIPAIIIGLAMFVVCAHALAFPVHELDVVSIWGLKAKVLATDSLRSDPLYFHDLSFSYSHLDYPLLLPFLIAGVYGITGSINDQAAKILFPLFYANLGVVIYWGLRWKISRIRSAFLTSIFMGMPILVRLAGMGYADTLLTLFFAASVVFTAKWLEEGTRSDLFLAALFVAFCALTKNEGMAMASIILAILFICSLGRLKRDRLFELFLFVLGVGALLLPWLWWARDLPRTHENYLSRVRPEIVMENIHRIGMIIPAFLEETVRLDRWGGLWFLVVVMAVLGGKAFRKKHVVVIWLLLLAHVGAYQFIFLITPWDAMGLIRLTLERLLLHVTPSAILIIGYHWAEIDFGRPGPQAVCNEPVLT